MKTLRLSLLIAGAGILIVAVAALSACGSEAPDGDRETAFVSRADPGCDVGGVSPVDVPRSGGVIVTQSPPTILACGTSPSEDRFYLVGFDTNHGICVTVDSVRQGETNGVICRDPRIPWLDFCEKGPGCVLRDTPVHDFTQILGVLDPKVKGIRASVKGSEEISDVTVATLDGELLRSLHRKEPVGFFALSLPGCVPVDDVRLEMLDAKGAELGLAHEPGNAPSLCGRQ